MTERPRPRQPELPQGIIRAWGIKLAGDLFQNCERHEEYRRAQRTVGQDRRTIVLFYLDKIRYVISFDPSAIKDLRHSPQKVVVKKRRGDEQVEERLTIILNQRRKRKPNRIIYENFRLRSKNKPKVEKDNQAAITHGRTLVNVRKPLDLSV